MKDRITVCLSLAAALAMSASTVARAGEPSTSGDPSTSSAPTRGEPAARTVANRSRATAHHGGPPSATARDNSPTLLVSPGVPPLGQVLSVPRAPSSDVSPSIDLDRAPAPPASHAPALLAGLANGPRTLVLSDALFEDRAPLELLSSVLLPAARGVTIAQIQTEGAPAVRLTVRPTKITRGSGLVAVGQF